MAGASVTVKPGRGFCFHCRVSGGFVDKTATAPDTIKRPGPLPFCPFKLEVHAACHLDDARALHHAGSTAKVGGHT